MYIAYEILTQHIIILNRFWGRRKLEIRIILAASSCASVCASIYSAEGFMGSEEQLKFSSYNRLNKEGIWRKKAFLKSFVGILDRKSLQQSWLLIIKTVPKTRSQAKLVTKLTSSLTSLSSLDLSCYIIQTIVVWIRICCQLFHPF